MFFVHLCYAVYMNNKVSFQSKIHVASLYTKFKLHFSFLIWEPFSETSDIRSIHCLPEDDFENWWLDFILKIGDLNLKIGDLTLIFKIKIELQTSKIFVLTLKN